MAQVIQLSQRGSSGVASVRFERSELDQILSVYFRFVSRGEWKDYAIAHGAKEARFCVFRHTNDRPLFTIAKADGKAANRYAVYEGTKKVRQGRRLIDVLGVFKKRSLKSL